MAINPPKKQTAKGAITHNWSAIKQWRDQGYTIPSIYEALVEQGKLSGSFANFQRYYHQIRKVKSSEAQLSTVAPAPAPAEQITSPLDDFDGNDKKVSIVTDESEFEKQKRLADAVFRRYRK
ncbi:MAG: hypothetical protein WA947_08510 [Phormidesmis sp.]